MIIVKLNLCSYGLLLSVQDDTLDTAKNQSDPTGAIKGPGNRGPLE